MDPKKLLLLILLLVLEPVVGQGPSQKCEAMGAELDKCQSKSVKTICHEQQHKFAQACSEPLCAQEEELFYQKQCYTFIRPECNDIIARLIVACDQYDVEVIHMD